MDLIQRPRRLRGSENLRKMVRETRMDKSSLIYPLFVKEGTGIEEEIPSMEGQFRYSVDRLPFELERLQNAGVNSIMLFGIPDHKDEVGSGAYDPNGIVQKALREAKKQFPDMYYITDVCMCEYTSHGHCGVLCGHDVNNDATLELLAKTAVSHVEAGADMVAPSDMMDGRVRAIRECLDKAGHKEAPIMSYAVKYASAFYGPFRDAAGSAPAFGDRKSYQMDYHNRREGMKEALTDIEEGADIIISNLQCLTLTWYQKFIRQPMFRSQLTASAVNMQWSKQQPRWAGSMRTRLCARWQQVLTVQVFLFI